MPEFHAEPYVYLPVVSHKSALVAWGGFYFRVRSDGQMKLMDDDDLDHVHPPRKDTIGARSAPYGTARVEVADATGSVVSVAVTDNANHCWITGLAPDTEYTYKVFVNGEEWAEGVRWDWSAQTKSLVKGGRYLNRFRTNPDPTTPASSLAFAVIGDFGVGVRKDSPDRCQQRVGHALREAVAQHGVRLIITTGDNIYAGRNFLGIPTGETGDEDDDWFFTYFQPYRYILNQIPVFPSIGNHDANETEDTDDREQVEDNLYVRERIIGEEAAGRASFDPGMFYRFGYGSGIEFICIDTSKESFFKDRLFEHPKHQVFLDHSFPAAGGTPIWRIPFSHHPPFSAGPRHHNTKSMQKLLPLFERAGVKAMFSGHEHNFQHSVHGGIHYFVSGAAGKLRAGVPDEFKEAHTRSWSNKCHFLLVTISGPEMRVRAIGEPNPTAPGLGEISRLDPSGAVVTEPMSIRLV